SQIATGGAPTILPTTGGKILTTSGSAGPPPMTISGTGNTDPYIEYTLDATNTLGVETFFQFAFGITITPSSDNSAMKSQLEVTLTDDGFGPLFLKPTYDGSNPSTGIQRALLSTDGGDFFPLFGEFGPLGGTITQAGTRDFQFDRPGASTGGTGIIYNYMELLVGFTLSPGDSVHLAGRIEIIPPVPTSSTPEPGTLTLALLCVVPLGVLKYRQRRGR
ncbi:MAG: hypothetical protein NT069_31555, partial [Planctomycetota bacterium]|nr:hypothetical protein [Planctomycetota bacterium]